MYKPYNPNPYLKRTEDCTIRAISKLFDLDWDSAYLDLMYKGLQLKDMPDSPYVWGAYLMTRGYERTYIPNTCPLCYTLRDFCNDNPKGKFAIATQNHVIAVVDGDYYDTWDSGDEVPVYYWKETTRNESR